MTLETLIERRPAVIEDLGNIRQLLLDKDKPLSTQSDKIPGMLRAIADLIGIYYPKGRQGPAELIAVPAQRLFELGLIPVQKETTYRVSLEREKTGYRVYARHLESEPIFGGCGYRDSELEEVTFLRFKHGEVRQIGAEERIVKQRLRVYDQGWVMMDVNHSQPVRNVKVSPARLTMTLALLAEGTSPGCISANA